MRLTGRIALLSFGIAAGALFSATSALAVDALCGGLPGPDKIPCACGDIVVTDTILDASDPVLKGGCFPVGLFVVGEPLVEVGVTLDAHALNPSRPGLCDRSLGFTTGIFIVGDNVTISRGVIRGCDEGIFGLTSGSTIERVIASGGSDAGIIIVGDSNALLANLCHDNALEGLVVFGDDNRLEQNYCARNGRDVGADGIVVLGDDNRLNRNRGERNGAQGVRSFPIFGANSSDGRNYGKGNAVAPDCQIDFHPGGTYC